MRAAIKAINSKKTAKRVYEALSAYYRTLVDEKTANHHDGMFHDSTFYKADGLPWWRDRCVSVAEDIISKQSVRSHFIPPSPETLAWGGFLGGETVHIKDAGKASSAMSQVLDIISKA